MIALGEQNRKEGPIGDGYGHAPGRNEPYDIHSPRRR